MKKTLVALSILTALLISAKTTFAACPCTEPQICPQATCPVQCPCEQATPCPCSCPCETPCPCEVQTPCACSSCCCDKWLSNTENYFCRIGLSDCQKMKARRAVACFQSKIKCLNLQNTPCDCKESRCDCRAYRKALKKLDCDMKNIITCCQKDNYKCIRKEVKCDVQKCHKCLISPFTFCKKCCKCCN